MPALTNRARTKPIAAAAPTEPFVSSSKATTKYLGNLNEAIAPLNGSLLPFGWAKLLWWLRKPKVRTMRVPLMGVLQRLQSSRMACQLAFMMIEAIRLEAIGQYGASRGELGWVLDDNQGMNAIADAIEGKVNKVYQIYEKAL